MKKTLREIAEFVGGRLDGDGSLEVSGVCSLAEPREGHIAFADRGRELELAAAGGAIGPVIAPEDAPAVACPLVRVKNPRLAFARTADLFHPLERRPAGVHPSAVVEPAARVHESVYVGALAVVEAGAEIGEGSQIGPGCIIGAGARVGKDCILHARVVLYPGSELGDRVILHSGVVIGADGFGYVQDGKKHVKLNQIGTVSIGDDVEIGALSAVDRATLGVTRIGAGTKIDNMVQVGHNVTVGENSILCGQVGLAGSCTLGAGVVLAGQAGVADHVKIADGAMLTGKAGVTGDILEAGVYSGMPARPHRETLRIFAALKKLPEIARSFEKEKEKT